MRTFISRILALSIVLALLVGVLPLIGVLSLASAEDGNFSRIVLFNEDFERGDETYWDLSGLGPNPVCRIRYDTKNSSYFLNMRPASRQDLEVHAAFAITLAPGDYYFSYRVCGKDTNNHFCGLGHSVWAGETLLTQTATGFATYGTKYWTQYQTDVFTLTEATEITFDFGGTYANSYYWVRLDDVKLYGTGGLAEEPWLDWITIPDCDFETGTGSWSLTGLPGEVIDNGSSAENPSKVLNLWVSNEEASEISASYSVNLTSGYYRFNFQMDGKAEDSNLYYTVSAGNDELCQCGPVVTEGWDVWQNLETPIFALKTTSTVTFTIHGEIPAAYWAHLDNLELNGTGVIYEDLPYIELPNSDFELGDASYWDLDGYNDSNVYLNEGSNINDTYVLHLWKGSADEYFVNICYEVTLLPGSYQFTYDLEGEDTSTTLQGIIEHEGICYYESDYLETYGWDEWTTYESGVFELYEITRMRFWLTGYVFSDYWGQFDNLRLYGTGGVYEGLPPMSTENGDFDYGSMNWSIRGFSEPCWNEDSAVNDSYQLPLWISNEEDTEASASYRMRLLAGSYELTFDLEGADQMSGLKAVVTDLGSELPESGASLRSAGTVLYESEELATHGFDQWETHRTDAFTLTQPGWVEFSLCGTVPAGYWGHFDNLKVWGDGDFYPTWCDHDPQLSVPKLNGVSEYEFVRGADISSYHSLVQAGAQFYDYEGNELDDEGFFQLLMRAGFNYVRIRVWVDPFDDQGRGYGGGNNDLDTAKYLARLATDAGLRVLIDFHYSDFWADPGKQQAPKAWAGYSLAEKEAAVEEYTYNSLKTIKQWSSEGYMVDMVQIGNETTSGFCGETNWDNMAQLFAAGARAVRRLDEERMEETKVTIHFTNPEKTETIKGFADKLDEYGVDYDVFATSWYPYWHGTTENLTNVLQYVADTYDKQVLVAETSWAWTLDDGDGWPNTVSSTSNSTNMPYAFSQQGQADELVAATRAVMDVGEKGLGVFCWENAWIPVEYAYDADGNLDQSILASNRQKWEDYGCGWASSYAGEYQADAAQCYGGSAVDNQAMFDFHGKALDSLWTWEYMMYGTEELFAGQEEPTEPIETDDLEVFYSVSVGTDMIISFTTLKEKMTNYDKFWIEVVKHEPTEDKVYKYGVDQEEALLDSNQSWKARFNHIFAKEMGLDVEARVYAQDANGQVWMSPAISTTIRDYLGGRLTAATNKVEQRVLAADMLNYGAAAQLFLDYDTDHLVNEELTAEQLAKLEEYETKELPPVEKTNSNYKPEGATDILFTSVTLGNEVQLKLTVNLPETTEGVQVLVKDHLTGNTVTTLETSYSGSSFRAVFNDIGASKMRTEYDLVTVVNGVETGNTRTWSVEAYVGEIRDGTNQLKTDLANALLTYGNSAAAYLAAK